VTLYLQPIATMLTVRGITRSYAHCTRSTEGAAHVTAADRVDASLAAKLDPDAFGSADVSR